MRWEAFRIVDEPPAPTEGGDWSLGRHVVKQFKGQRAEVEKDNRLGWGLSERVPNFLIKLGVKGTAIWKEDVPQELVGHCRFGSVGGIRRSGRNNVRGGGGDHLHVTDWGPTQSAD